MEDPNWRSLASEDPRGFLAQFREKGVILDEVQRAPDLFSYIQTCVDEVERPGSKVSHFVPRISFNEKYQPDLAGRCAIFHLLPFSMNELRQLPQPMVEGIGQKIPSIPEPEDANVFDLSCLQGFIP
ncbi:MAG: AAA family ATPase [Desulfobacterales bacterium]